MSGKTQLLALATLPACLFLFDPEAGVCAKGFSTSPSTSKSTPTPAKPTAVQLQAEGLAKQARTFNKIMESEQALDLANQALKVDPKCGMAYLERADAYKALGRLDKAISDYKTVRVVGGADARKDGAHHLAELFFYMKRYDEGVATVDSVEKAGDQLTDGMLETRAKCNSALGKHDLAAIDLTVALKTIPDQTRILDMRAEEYVMAHKWNQALADYNVLIARDEKADGQFGANAHWYTERAKIYDALGKKSLAVKDRAKAGQLETNNFNLAPFRTEKKRSRSF